MWSPSVVEAHALAARRNGGRCLAMSRFHAQAVQVQAMCATRVWWKAMHWQPIAIVDSIEVISVVVAWIYISVID